MDTNAGHSTLYSGGRNDGVVPGYAQYPMIVPLGILQLQFVPSKCNASPGPSHVGGAVTVAVFVLIYANALPFRILLPLLVVPIRLANGVNDGYV